MSNSLFFRIHVAVACCLFSGMVPKTYGAPNITIKDVLDAWKKRQERVQTCRFAWEGELTHPKESLPGKRNMRSGEVGPAQPKEDTTVSRRITLTLDRNQMRYTNEGLKWLSDEERFVELSYSVRKK